MVALANSRVRTYGMQERADHLDFDIRMQGARDELQRPHRHEYFQMQIGFDGGSTQSIGAATRPFGPGYLSYVLPYRIHVIPHPWGASYCIVNFRQKFLWPQLDVNLLDLESLPVSRYPELAPFLFQEYIDFHIQPDDFFRIRSWLCEMHQLNRHRRFGAISSIKGLLHQIIGLTCMRYEAELMHQSVQYDGKASQHDALQRVIRYVRDNLEKEMSLTEAAEAASLSPNYLAHLLKKETGKTFTGMVTERRLEQAKELLSASRQQIKEVAHQCGFNDEAYFNRRFKQWVGMTPKQYRDQQIATRRI